MASIVRRDNKSGITYRIQVKTKDKGSGQIITHSTTWKPVPGVSEKQMQREVIVFADQYEAQIAAGVPLVTVAGRAGHARTSTTTDIYSHFLKSSDKTAAKMPETIFEP